MKEREIAGIKVFVSGEVYNKYKGTLQEQLEEKDKEIEKLNNNMQILQDDLDIIGKELGLEEGSCFEDVLDSIDRLNNIIEELEKWLKEDKEYAMNNFECGRCFNMFNILDKLKELKEGK